MSLSRRAALTLAAGAGLAACQRKLTTTPHGAGPMDTKVLDAGFPALADRARPGAFALGVMNLATTATWYWNTNRAFPLAGAAALPAAVTALSQVEARKLAPNQTVTYTDLDLSQQPSLVSQFWPKGAGRRTARISLQTLMALALREGDNTAIDVLMDKVGGPGAVTAFLQLKQITGVRIDRYMRDQAADLWGLPSFKPEWHDPAPFHAARDQTDPPQRQAAMDRFVVDPRDSATVPAALGFLALLAGGELISKASVARLMGLMQDAPPGRFAAGLPEGATVARAMGETLEDLGFVAATTELAIATFPGNRRYALAGFLVGSTATEAQRAALFADAARLAAQAIG